MKKANEMNIQLPEEHSIDKQREKIMRIVPNSKILVQSNQVAKVDKFTMYSPRQTKDTQLQGISIFKVKKNPQFCDQHQTRQVVTATDKNLRVIGLK